MAQGVVGSLHSGPGTPGQGSKAMGWGHHRHHQCVWGAGPDTQETSLYKISIHAFRQKLPAVPAGGQQDPSRPWGHSSEYSRPKSVLTEPHSCGKDTLLKTMC